MDTDLTFSEKFKNYIQETRQLLLLVFLPTLLGIVYYGAIASDMYVSDASLTVRSMNGSNAAAPSILSSLVGGMVSSTNEMGDSSIIKNYIESKQILDALDEQVGIRKRYAIESTDILARLDPAATKEAFFEYYRSKIIFVSLDDSGRVISLTVNAFTPEDAQLIAQKIIVLTELMVNGISKKSRDDAVKFSQDVLAKAESRLSNVKSKMAAFRKRKGDLDPVSSAASYATIIASLESQLAQERANLVQMQSYMKPRSDTVKRSRSLVQALEKQIVSERVRLVAPDDASYTDIVGDYTTLLVEEEFAQSAYTAAVVSSETARAEVLRQQRYLVAFVSPNLPEEATEPQRAIMMLSIFLGSLVVYGIFSLVIAAIREHARL